VFQANAQTLTRHSQRKPQRRGKLKHRKCHATTNRRFTDVKSSCSYVQYRARDKPWYSLGHGIVLMYIIIGWLTSLAFMILLRRENEKRERSERDEVITGGVGLKPGGEGDAKGGVYESVEEAKRDKGDGWSGYRYIT
jgi:hypothetical protein